LEVSETNRNKYKLHHEKLKEKHEDLMKTLTVTKEMHWFSMKKLSEKLQEKQSELIQIENKNKNLVAALNL
jgi:hypothetical protein